MTIKKLFGRPVKKIDTTQETKDSKEKRNNLTELVFILDRSGSMARDIALAL